MKKKVNPGTGSHPRMTLDETVIDALPKECWLRVLSFLSIEDLLQLKRVSQNCKELVLSLWETRDTIDLVEEPQLNNHLVEILQCCDDVLEKVLIPLSHDSTVLPKLLEYCFELKQITVVFEDHQNQITRYQQLSTLFQQNPNLQVVKLYNVGKDFHKHWDCLLELPQTMDHLELSTFKPHRIFEPMLGLPFTFYKNFDAVLSCFQCLRSLKLYGFRMNVRQMKAIENMENLENLEIYDCERPCNFQAITRLTKLEELHLYFVSELNEAWFTNLAANCKNLKFLRLIHCPITDAWISKLGQLEKLEWLILKNVMGPINGEGFANLKSLKVLHCFYYDDVSDSAIIKLLQVAPNLEYLGLIGSGITARVLEFANSITKQRTNNTMLHLHVDSEHFVAWVTGMKKFKQNYISPWLSVETH